MKKVRQFRLHTMHNEEWFNFFAEFKKFGRDFSGMIKNMKRLIIIIVLLQLIACKNVDNTAFFPAPTDNQIDIKYHQIHVDSIILNDEGVECSLEGFSGITHDKKYYFVDSRFCWFYVFDLSGNFISRSLGSGPGPQETTIGEILYCCLLSDTSLFVSGSMHNYFVYGKDFYLKKYFMLPYMHLLAPDSENWRNYTFAVNVICRHFEDRIYLNMYSDWLEFNYFTMNDEYLKKGKHIFEINLDTKHAEKMHVNGYPPVYHEDRNLYGCGWFINFDIDNNGCFYVSFEADSVIYKYDNSFTPLYSFGYSGKNMNTKYVRVGSFGEMGEHYSQERMDKGFYDWVEYVDETGLLFRSYKKGSHDANDGLQIYSGTKLIADVDVPKNLRVVGYVEPYYYSHVITDEEKEIMVVYRFKLD